MWHHEQVVTRLAQVCGLFRVKVKVNSQKLKVASQPATRGARIARGASRPAVEVAVLGPD